jgi:hypothetical protein
MSHPGTEVTMHKLPVELSAFHRRDLSLAGFLLHGRWPDSTLEWSQVLALAVRIAAVPGILATTTVFRAVDDKPAVGDSHAVGVMASAGPVLGDDAPAPGSLSQPCPPALFVLHPPSETTASLPEIDAAASGVVWLPGVPELGLEHRAAWVEAGADGTVTRLISALDVDPWQDPDLAVLAILTAA